MEVSQARHQLEQLQENVVTTYTRNGIYLALACALLACGSDSEDAAPAGEMMMAATGAGGASGVDSTPPKSRRDPGAAPGAPGFMLPADYCNEKRVSYSAPCHGNPDPCGLGETGWPGDEYCLPAPAPGEGIQIHIGPDDYADEAEVAKYVINPGEEFNNSVVGHIELDESRWYNRVTVSMRPGSHHWISTVVEGKPEERFYSEADMSCGATSIGSIGGGQNLIYDNPPDGVPAPENVGWGGELPGNSSVCMNLHAYNYSDRPMLREMWINLYFVDEADVTLPREAIGVVAGTGIAIPPGESQTITYEMAFGADGRILDLYGHRHVWTPRFAAWLNDRLIYDSWSWQESVVYNYDSITTNPPINTEAMVDGAVSGVVEFKTGDIMKFSCFIENGSDKTLMWRNELYGGEMCNLWGSTVGKGTALRGFFP
jgi:hypothetical protein